VLIEAAGAAQLDQYKRGWNIIELLLFLDIFFDIQFFSEGMDQLE
jgi:hypothetical protein